MAAPPLFYETFTVTASPADATEIVVATLTGVASLGGTGRIKIYAWANVTLAAAATAAVLKVRRSTLTGTQVAPTVTVAVPGGAGGATTLNCDARVVDAPGAVDDQTYVLTLTMTAAATASTVNAVSLCARVD